MTAWLPSDLLFAPLITVRHNRRCDHVCRRSSACHLCRVQLRGHWERRQRQRAPTSGQVRRLCVTVAYGKQLTRLSPPPVYVRGDNNQDISYCVEKVVFTLHHTFKPPVRGGCACAARVAWATADRRVCFQKSRSPLTR